MKLIEIYPWHTTNTSFLVPNENKMCDDSNVLIVFIYCKYFN